MSTQWDGIPTVFPSTPCDLCKSKEKVDRKQVKIHSEGCIKVDFPYRQSNLCENCKSQGWMFFSVDIHGLTYYNTQTQEFKHF